jgi:hypothetical protein
MDVLSFARLDSASLDFAVASFFLLVLILHLDR